MRQFDAVMLDRLKVIRVEPDLDVWKAHAVQEGIHGAILSFLTLNGDAFYSVTSQIGFKQVVTPRSWEDLSVMLAACETIGETVDLPLIEQYLQNDEIARNFAAYYELYRRYREIYRVDQILAGVWSSDLIEQAAATSFETRIGLSELFSDTLLARLRAAMRQQDALKALVPTLNQLRQITDGAALSDALTHCRQDIQKKLDRGMMERETQQILLQQRNFLSRYQEISCTEGAHTFDAIKAAFDRDVMQLQKDTCVLRQSVEHALRFTAEAFGQKNELLLLLLALTHDPASMRFISQFGCDAYFLYSKELLPSADRRELLHEIDRLEGREK